MTKPTATKITKTSTSTSKASSKKDTCTSTPSTQTCSEKETPSTSPHSTSTCAKTVSGTATTTAEISWDKRNALVAEAAYYNAVNRGFRNGTQQDDWYRAEKQVDTMLKNSGKRVA